MKTTIHLVHAFNVEVQVSVEPSAFAPDNTLYVVPRGDDFLKMARTMYQAEKEKNDWIRKYGNVLKGLEHWKQRALANENPVSTD